MDYFESPTDHKEADEAREVEALRKTLADLCSDGPYSESLEVLGDGTIGLERRATDGSPPLLPNLLSSELGVRDVEAFYRLARDIERKLPEFGFSISEGPERRSLTYKITRRAR
jgi:hypothetical protein